MSINNSNRKFSLKTVKELAIKLIGTAKGLQKENPYYFFIQMEYVTFDINYDLDCDAIRFTVKHDGHSISSYYNPDTLDYDYELTEWWNKANRLSLVEETVYRATPKYKEKLKAIANGEYPDTHSFTLTDKINLSRQKAKLANSQSDYIAMDKTQELNNY